MGPTFDGQTYDQDRDQVRLAGMLAAVESVMADRDWHTLAELSAATGGSEAACSARLRDLRKPRFGAHTVHRRHVGHGLWVYQYEPNTQNGRAAE